jgi:hypothetical protein
MYQVKKVTLLILNITTPSFLAFVTNSMTQDLPWAVHNYSDVKKFPTSMAPDNKNLPLDNILIHLNPVYVFTPDFSTIHSNITLHPMHSLSIDFFSWNFPCKVLLYKYLVSPCLVRLIIQINLTVLSNDYTLWSSSLCAVILLRFIYSPLLSSLFS